MTIRDLNTRRVPHYRLLASGKVQQRFGDDDVVLIDPAQQMRDFADRAGETVRAVQIPTPFRVAGDLCTDGYLVLDHKGLRAVSTRTFQRDYSPALQLGA